MTRSKVVIALALIALTVGGCGSNLLRTRGKVVKGGTPLIPAEGEFVRVTFVPILATGETVSDYYVAEFNREDGSFRVSGKNRKGMPPG